MKKLYYKGYKFLYKIEEYDCGDYGVGTCYETKIYDSNITTIFKSRKKYYLFGPLISIRRDKYKHLFTLEFNIESKHVSKKKLEKALDSNIKLLTRENEIKRGVFFQKMK